MCSFRNVNDAKNDQGDAQAQSKHAPSQAALLFGANGLFLFFFLALLIPTEEHPWLRPVVDVVSSYFDCVIFAATWQVCRLDRDTPSESDFEF